MSNSEKAIEKAKGALVKKEEAKQPTTISQWLSSEGFKAQMALVLPKHIESDRMARICLGAIRQNPKLGQCNVNSLLGAVMQSAMLGLEPSSLGHCYFVPYGQEVQFILGYKGMIELMMRSGKTTGINVEIIYENDEIDVDLGVNRKLNHKPYYLCGKKEKGEPIAVYMTVQWANGQMWFNIVGMDEVWQHKAKSKSANSSNSPWHTDEEAMIKKTAVRISSKYVPQSLEWRTLDSNRVNLEEVDESVKNIDESHLLALPTENIIDVDPETGEVLREQA